MKLMNAMSRALLLAVPLSAGIAEAAEYSQVQQAGSRMGFVSRQMGVAVEGGFRQFAAQLSFDPAHPELARASIDIQLASADAGSKDANAELAGRNWFNVSQFPVARFVSTGVRRLGDGRYEARGQLSIKGRSREVVAPFTFRPLKGAGLFEGGFTLRRLDYGIGEGPWGDTGIVADEVQIRFRILAAEGGGTPPQPAGNTRRPAR